VSWQTYWRLLISCPTKTRCLLLPKLPALLAEARALSESYKGGGDQSFSDYKELVSLLFRTTVMATGGGFQLNAGPGQEPRRVISPLGGPTSPLPLNDGDRLRLSISLFLGATEKAPGIEGLKVAKEAFQYQLDDPQRWIFRYEYERDRSDSDEHPPAHLHLRASLETDTNEALAKPFERVHFPTGRVSIPAIIRLLIEQFGVQLIRGRCTDG
jgi:hypothetical protein